MNDLARELAGVPFDEAEPIASQIQKLVLDHMQEWLSAHPAAAEPVESPLDIPYEVKVRRELEGVFSQLRYPLFGKPATFARPWRNGTLVGVGYTLGWTDQDRANVVAVLEEREGKTRLAALTCFVPQTDLHYAFPVPPAASSGDFWMIVYGTRLGKSHPRLTAVLYAFDGGALKPLWETRDVYDGKFELIGSDVVIRHMKEQEFIQAVVQHQAPPRYEAVYKVAPNGLELESDRQIPK